MYSKVIICLTLLSSISAFAKLNVVTTTTDIAWLANQIGKEEVKVRALLKGTEDPHFVEALPSFIHKAANADLFCEIGLELESAWSKKVKARSGNKDIQDAAKGSCDLSKQVEVLGKLDHGLDRSHGDVHSAGNPHYHLGPSYLLMAGKELRDKLTTLSPKKKEFFEKNYQKLAVSLDSYKKEKERALQRIKSLSFMEYHKEFTYFLKDYDLKNIESVEEISGVPPSASRIIKVINLIKENKVSAILATTNAPKTVLDKIASATGVKIIYSPLSIEDYTDDQSYNKLQDNIIDQLLKIK